MMARVGVSREKLAYIVDSTAAPIASLALVSTWVGYEVGLVGDGLAAAGQDLGPYAFFVEGIGYRFYSLFTIVFVGAIAITGRDFGPMAEAEKRALSRGPVSEADEDTPPGRGAAGAGLPIATLLGLALWLMWDTGREGLPAGAPLFEILGNADSAAAMFQASGVALVLSVVLGRMLGGLRGCTWRRKES